MCTKLDNMKNLIENKCRKFMDRLMCDMRFSNVLIVFGWNSLCNL